MIVLGNEKGGAGKSTLAMHLAVALSGAGQRVATIDLDRRQRSLTHYIENREAWSKQRGLKLQTPRHFSLSARPEAGGDDPLAEFADIVLAAEDHAEFVVVDTPALDTGLTRLAHAMADTLLTPLNDSFVDFDVLGSVDPVSFAVTGVSHYARLAREARRERGRVDGRFFDWIVVRNRLSVLNSRNKRLMAESLRELGLRLAFGSSTASRSGCLP